MPINISDQADIKPGDIYEDSAYHPCLCLGVGDMEVWGISLIDGSYPRSEDIGLSGLRKLSLDEAWIWKTKGSQDASVKDIHRWW